MDGITLQGTLAKISTTVDGGWNVTFSVGQDQVQAIMQLSELRDTLMQLGCIPVEALG